MQQKEPIELEFDVNTSDFRKVMLLVASGRKRSTNPWPTRRLFALTTSGVGAALFLLAASSSRLYFLPAGVTFPLGMLYAILFVAYLLLPGFNAAWAASRTIGALGRQRWLIDDEDIRIEAKDMWTNRRWSSINNVECIRGDIFLFLDQTSVAIVPATTFASLPDAESVYRSISGRISAARSSNFNIEPVSSSAWPPPPRPASDVAPPEPAGPEIAEVGTLHVSYELTEADFSLMDMVRPAAIWLLIPFAIVAIGYFSLLRGDGITYPFGAENLVIFITAAALIIWRRLQLGHKSLPRPMRKQAMRTDFATLRVDTAETSTAYRVGAFTAIYSGVASTKISTAPSRALTIPDRAFASRAESRAFAKRLAASAKIAKQAGKLRPGD